jgi:ribosomal protein S21
MVKTNTHRQRDQRDRRVADAAVVILDPGQSIDRTLKTFTRRVARSRVLPELRARQAYRPPSARRRIKARRARRRDAKAATKRAHAFTSRSDEHTKDDAP